MAPRLVAAQLPQADQLLEGCFCCCFIFIFFKSELRIFLLWIPCSTRPRQPFVGKKRAFSPGLGFTSYQAAVQSPQCLQSATRLPAPQPHGTWRNRSCPSFLRMPRRPLAHYLTNSDPACSPHQPAQPQVPRVSSPWKPVCPAITRCAEV